MNDEAEFEYGRFAYQIGDQLEDEITSFQGICTGRLEYVNGCVQYLVQPRSHDGKHTDAYWIDEERLRLVQTDAFRLRKRTRPGSSEPPPARG